jgi:glutamine---fructose-6-phosphate transaminase (isomerizing)
MLAALACRPEDMKPLAAAVQSHRHVVLTGCGSAFYAASLGAGWLQEATDSWIDVIPASEVGPSTRHMGSDTLVIALTQSGETADVVDAIQLAESWGATIATIINTETSTIANMAEIVVPILAGVERSVLATKSFMAMAVRLYQTASTLDEILAVDLAKTVVQIREVLADVNLARIAESVAAAPSMIVLGKDAGRAVAQEAALKIKEGSYLHAEAFLSGELKHGPLALVQAGTPCLIFATSEAELKSARIAAAEVMSRGGFVVGFGEFAPEECSAVVPLPSSGTVSSLVHLVAAQTLAFHIAIERGVDPDFPRNLAKSVTVR